MEMKNLFNCGLTEIKLVGGDEDAPMTFSGYGAVFGNVDAYGDVIIKGAFEKTILEAKATGIWPAMLAQHGGWGMDAESMMPVGIYTELREDDHGLYIEGKLADTQRGIEVYKLLKMDPRPAFNGLSIGYYPIRWKNRDKPEDPRRTLEEIKLVEVSLVTFPANGKARVESVKSFPDKRFIENTLCDAGISRSQAKRLVASGYDTAFGHCDDDADAAEIRAMIQRNIKSLRGK